MNSRPPLFAPRTLAWVVGVSVVSFLLAFALAAYGDALTGDVTAGADSYSYSAIGHHAFAELLGRLGIDVERRTGPRAGALGPGTPLLLLEPGSGWGVGAWDDVGGLLDLARDRDAPVVLALPKWGGRPDGSRRRLEVAVPLPETVIERRLNDLLATREAGTVTLTRGGADRARTCERRDDSAATYRVDVRSLQLLDDSDALRPVVRCPEGLLVADVVGLDGAIVRVVADPDVLNNHGLGRADHAALVLDVTVGGLEATGVVFEETVHGHAASGSLVREALSFPLVLAVVHGLLAIGAIVWTGAVRFGTPRPAAPPHADGTRVLIDNAAQLLSLGRHSAGSLERYFQRTLRAVAARLGLPTDRDLDGLVAELQRLSESRNVDIRLDTIRERVRTGVQSDGHAVRLARHLHRWRKEMTDGPAHDT